SLHAALPIFLYDELMKRLIRAELALDQKNYELFDQSIQRSKEIIWYLDDTLDRQYPISVQLSRLYEYFTFQLSRVAASRNKKILEELKPYVNELRDAFRTAQKNTNQ